MPHSHFEAGQRQKIHEPMPRAASTLLQRLGSRGRLGFLFRRARRIKRAAGQCPA